MVQSYEHEVYRSILPHGQLGSWGLSEDYQGDETDDHHHGLSSSLGDRTSAWCVSVPGESSWVFEVRHVKRLRLSVKTSNGPGHRNSVGKVQVRTAS